MRLASNLSQLVTKQWVVKAAFILLVFFTFLIAFILLHSDFFADNVYPIRDSLHYHFNSYHFLIISIWKEAQIPSLFPAGGGVPYVLSAMSYGLLMPYKLLSMSIYPFFSDPVSLWKISVAIGYSYFATGLFFVCRSISNNTILSFFICLFTFQTGFSNSFHQEQVIYTIIHAPFLYLALDNFFRNPSSLLAILIGCILGLMSFTHFPQIQIFIVFGTILFSKNLFINPFNERSVAQIFIYLFLGISAFIIFALPTFFFLNSYDDIILPQRIFSGFSFVPPTLKVIFSSQKLPGAEGLYFCGLAGFDRTSSLGLLKCFFELSVFGVNPINREHQIGLDDATILHVGPLFFIAFIIALSISVRAARREVAFIAVLFFLFIGPVGATIGFPAKLASLVFGEFRQWYHFFPVVFYFSILLIVKTFSIQKPKTSQNHIFDSMKIAFVFLLPLTFLFNEQRVYMTASHEKPLPFAQHTNQVLWSNPGLLSFKSREKFCKESLFRNEPSSFVNDAVLGFYIDKSSENAVTRKLTTDTCFSPNTLTNFRKSTSGVLIRSDYAVRDTDERPVPISIENMENKEKNLDGLIDVVKISPSYGNLIFEGQLRTPLTEAQSIVVSTGKSYFICNNAPTSHGENKIKTVCIIPRRVLLSEEKKLGMFKILMIDGNTYSEIPKSGKIQDRSNLVIEPVQHFYENGAYKMKFNKPKKDVYLFLNSENKFETSSDVEILEIATTEPTIRLVSKNGHFEETLIEVSSTIKYTSILSFFIMIVTNFIHFCTLVVSHNLNERKSPRRL